jgi:hypothetical protein
MHEIKKNVQNYEREGEKSRKYKRMKIRGRNQSRSSLRDSMFPVTGSGTVFPSPGMSVANQYDSHLLT